MGTPIEVASDFLVVSYIFKMRGTSDDADFSWGHGYPSEFVVVVVVVVVAVAVVVVVVVVV